MGAGLDLHAVVGAAGQIVAVLGALHEVRLALGVARDGLGLLALLLEQLGVLFDEVFVLVAAGLLGHGVGTLLVEARGRQAAIAK